MTAKKPKKDDVAKLQDEIKQDFSDELENAADGEVISKKKVIYIEIDDEISTVYEKLGNLKSRHVYIVVPKRAVIFQSIVNLKILKRKAQDDGKTIYFITNDKNGIYLAQELGITVYDKINTDGKPSLFSTELNDDKMRITPLKAAVNAVTENAPTRLMEKKLSISEILRKKRGKKSVEISRISGAKSLEKKKERPKFVLVTPNRQALMGLLVFSFFILLVIVYIALPGATVMLTPSASVLEKSVNITLADYQKNRAELETRTAHMIATYPLEITMERELKHTATGKRFSERNTNASGTLTIVNVSNTEWPLIPNTRFQTQDGIVFRISDYVTVPPATAEGPGKTDAFVVADEVDAYGQPVGERGNIEPSKFFLPGLRDDSKSKLYAESSAPMTGGMTDYVTYISAEDLEAARVRMQEELKTSAVEELKKALVEKAALAESEAQYILLEGDGAIKISEPVVNVPPGLENAEQTDFTVSGTMIVRGVYYNRQEMLDILKSELLVKKSPQKELLRINEESTSYRIFEWDENSGKIKVTANIKGVEQYEIDPSKENGQRLLKKIREHIVGKEIEEAKLYIQNLPEINKVEIKSWPVWSPTIPNIPDNIDFEVIEAVTAQ